MQKSEIVKEKILEATKQLIKNSDGNVDQITIRNIASSANVGVGLINYHFGSKDKLIELSVQSMIKDTITNRADERKKETVSIDSIISGAEYVMNFFYQNPEVSKISINADLSQPNLNDNTMKSLNNIVHLIASITKDEKEARLIAYTLIAFMQTSFLRKELSKDFMGYDINEEDERNFMLKYILEKFLGNLH